MMEKLSIEEKIKCFDNNFGRIKEQLLASATASGRSVDDIILLAATKTVPVEVINYAIDKGLSYIGENRVQEFISKYDNLKPCTRHFIGHLQTNKVKDIIDKVDMIQSVHSLKLAKEISKQAARVEKNMQILIEVNIGREESKSGFFEEELHDAVCEIAKLDNLQVMGLMAIPPICDNNEQLKNYFLKMHKLFVEIQTKNLYNVNMVYLSMGMSEDFPLAVACGANMVRIGSALFGKRNYNIK